MASIRAGAGGGQLEGGAPGSGEAHLDQGRIGGELELEGGGGSGGHALPATALGGGEQEAIGQQVAGDVAHQLEGELLGGIAFWGCRDEEQLEALHAGAGGLSPLQGAVAAEAEGDGEDG
jgi:hypothetical protein